MPEVFVSYSWDSDEHNLQVLSFTNFLRNNGIDAQVDRFLMLGETAIDFFKMMHRHIEGCEKVIIVLSKGYKHKANSFSGGVGKEYELIIKDIDEHPQKYIIISFEGIKNNIVPLAFSKRHIHDLSPLNREKAIPEILYKIFNISELEIAPVANKRIALKPKRIPEFLKDQKDVTSVKKGKGTKKTANTDKENFILVADKLLHRIDEGFSEYNYSEMIDDDLTKRTYGLEGVAAFLNNVIFEIKRLLLYANSGKYEPENLYACLHRNSRDFNIILSNIVYLVKFLNKNILAPEIHNYYINIIYGKYISIINRRQDELFEYSNRLLSVMDTEFDDLAQLVNYLKEIETEKVIR